MKKLQLFLALIILHFTPYFISAQAPNAIPYQAVARDNAGNPIANQAVSLRFTIRDVTAAGAIVYRETQSKTTNSLGLFTANIGQGTLVSGTFESIDWGSGPKFMQVEMDVAGGTSYTDMGTQQMLSVPYALYAEKIAAIADPINAGSNNIPSGTIPDASCTGITSTITVSGQAASVNSVNIRVTLDITHTYDGDLNIYLIAPNGSILCLASGNGGNGQNFTNTIFSDASSTTILSGAAPFSGTYKPNGALSGVCSTTPTVSTFAAIGGGTINPNGTWSLKIFDQTGLDVGTLNSWSVSIANPVTGSTANYIPKWNSSTSFAPSTIFDNGNVGIGTSSPSAKLEVNGQVKITGGTPGAGKVLTSDNTGLATWTTPAATGSHFIGELYGGGIVFYVYDNGQHGLIAATADLNGGGPIGWFADLSTNTMAYAGRLNPSSGGVGGGRRNTDLIIASQGMGDSSIYAARACNEYSVTVAGVTYQDWYLPSINELQLLYLYKIFFGGLANDYYWSSTEYSSGTAFVHNFSIGAEGVQLKGGGHRVRAVRAF